MHAPRSVGRSVATLAELPLLRREARQELDARIERRARAGQDPAVFLPQMPSLDETVVLSLRDDALEREGLSSEFALARISVAAGGPDADYHRQVTDDIELQLLRRIAEDYPPLARAVWSLIGHIGA